MDHKARMATVRYNCTSFVGLTRAQTRTAGDSDASTAQAGVLVGDSHHRAGIHVYSHKSGTSPHRSGHCTRTHCTPNHLLPTSTI